MAMGMNKGLPYITQSPTDNVLNLTNAVTYQNPEAYSMIIRILSSLLPPAIILFGLITNTINIIVFLRAGAKDNVTILLLSLTVSDLASLIIIAPSMCFFVIQALFKSFVWSFDPYLLLYLPYWPAQTAFDLSALISVSLGVTRCACVAMPLKFKHVFTRSRTIKWIMFLVVLAVSLRLPVLTIYRISWRTNPKTNVSSPYLKAVNTAYMLRINDILNRGIMIYILYFSMVTCVVVLTFKLYQASKVRRYCTTGQARASDRPPDMSLGLGLTSKDLQVVKSVVLVCTVFILSQLPFVISSTIRLIIPQSNNIKELVIFFGFFSHISRTFTLLNASVNIFMYYNYNSKFRSAFCSLFFSYKNNSFFFK